MRKFFLPLLVALGLFATAMPAQAAPLQWTDPAGDAGFYPNSAVDVALPTPNEPALDVLRARVETKGDNLVWTVEVAKLGAANPNGSTGISYTWSFTYGAGSYTLTVIDDLMYGKATEMRGGTTGAVNPLQCGKCAGVMDRKTSKVVITTPISSVSRAIRGVDSAAKALAGGAKLEKLSVSSVRNYGFGHPDYVAGRFNFVSDKSAPAADATFTV